MTQKLSLQKDMQYLEKKGHILKTESELKCNDKLNLFYTDIFNFSVKCDLGLLETLFLMLKANGDPAKNEILSENLYQIFKNNEQLFTMTKSFPAPKLFAKIVEEMAMMQLTQHQIYSSTVKKYMSNTYKELAEFSSKSGQIEKIYFDAKGRYHIVREELGEITYEIQSQKLENKNITTLYREKFPEIIDVQAAFMQQEQLQLQLDILKEDPHLSLDEVFEQTKGKRDQMNKELNKMRLDAAMGERKAWFTGYNLSIDEEGLAEEKQKGKHLAREIAMLTHEDVVKRNPEYKKLTHNQKKELKDCFRFAMRIKSDEIGFSPNQVGFGIRSSEELKIILNKIKGILSNAGMDIHTDLLPAGNTLEEKAIWFKEQTKLFEMQVEKAKIKLTALLNTPDIKEIRKHLACPESYDQIRFQLKQLVKKHEKKNAAHTQKISNIIYSRGA